MSGVGNEMSGCGFLGLGAMGAPMADAILGAGWPVTVWNRTAAKAAPLVERGADRARTPAEAARSIVLTMLTDLPQLEEVLRGDDGLLEGWRRNAVADPLLVVLGTVSPRGVADLAAELSNGFGVRVVDAPVSGGVIGAQEARLSIFVGGADDDVVRARPYLETMATAVRHLGPVGSGSLGKACNQLIVAGTIAAISEAMLLARRSGLDAAALLALLNNGLAGSELLRQKGTRWIQDDFSPSGAARNQLKDLRFAAAAADEQGLALPITSLVQNLFQLMVDTGDGDLDHTGLYRTIESMASGERR